MIARLMRSQLLIAPPLLSAPVRMFAGLDKTAAIYRLAKRFTPEAASHLFSTSPTGAARKFVEAFSKLYFPLSWESRAWDTEANFERLVRGIPVVARAFDLDQYDYMWRDGTGAQLAVILLQKPPRCNCSRVVALQNAIQQLNLLLDGAVARVPADGWPLAFVIEKTESRWPGLAARCRWLYRRTGNIWLDGWTLAPRWTKADVEALSAAWEPCLKIEKQMRDFDDWLRTHSPAEVIDYIAGGKL